MDLSWPDSTYEQLDAQGRYDNTILALLSLLKAESTRQPLILFIEDVHFLDDDFEEIYHAFEARTPGRDNFLPDCGSHDHSLAGVQGGAGGESGRCGY